MNWLFLFSPRAGTIAGAAWFAWSWARNRVNKDLAFGSQQIIHQVMSFCTINLLAACGRWSLYILALLTFEFIDFYLGFNGNGGAILAIFLKYFIAASLGFINLLTLWKADRLNAFLHPFQCLRKYLVARTVEVLKGKLGESVLKKMFFYITWHNAEEEAAKIVDSSFHAVIKILCGTAAAYLLMLFLFGKLYQAILEACLGIEYSSMLEYLAWPFAMVFS